MAIKKISDMPIANQFSLLMAVEHPSMTYVDKAYIREDGHFFFHNGKPHSYKKPLDRNIPEEAQRILRGEKENVVKCEGLYIGANPRGEDKSKRISFDVSFEDIISEKKRIIEAYIPVLKMEKKKKNIIGTVTPNIDAQIDALQEELAEAPVVKKAKKETNE